MTFRILAPLSQYAHLFRDDDSWLQYLHLARELAHDVVLIDWPNRDEWQRAVLATGGRQGRDRMEWEDEDQNL